MSNGNEHDRSNPPAVLVGGAHGRLKGNRHVVAKKDEPTANLLLAMAHLAGAEIESLGPSTGASTCKPRGPAGRSVRTAGPSLNRLTLFEQSISVPRLCKRAF